MVRFLGQCGFAVETTNHFLVFDYVEKMLEDYPFLKTKAGKVDLAFVPPFWEEKWTYGRMNSDFIRILRPAAAFPMHVRVGDEDQYFPAFEKAYAPFLEDGRVVLTRNIKGAVFVYKNGTIDARR